MPEVTRLEISLAATAARPAPGTSTWNLHRGGRAELLGWLETRLGLLSVDSKLSSRIAQYANALDQARGASFAASLATDRWGTAATLLARREELRLAGWDGADRTGLPPLVRDLARVDRPSDVDESDRLDRALDLLDRGARLPEHRVVLDEPAELWPVRWRRVLARLVTEPAATPVPAAPAGRALGRLQRQVLAASAGAVPPDPSLVWVSSRSTTAACEAVAAALAAEPGALAGTVILCESAAAALLLDGFLEQAGLPTLGASQRTLAHPALQVLPLTLRLSFEPVDPQTLLELLALPIGPIPGSASRPLLAALTEQPGMGSQRWEAAWAALTAPEADPEGKVRDLLTAWLRPRRERWGAPLTADHVASRCQLVSEWALGRAMAAARKGDELGAEALRIAAGQARSLGELVAVTGARIEEPQLARLLDAVRGEGAGVQPRPELAGGARLVSRLADVEDCDRLVWLGLGTQKRTACSWTALEVAQLQAAGIEVDDGSRALAALARAEQRAFARTRSAVLAWSLPEEAEQRAHPIWLQIESALELASPDRKARPLQLERVAASRQAGELGPWPLTRRATALGAPPGARPEWPLPGGLLVEPEGSSATELILRLQCPLGWVFKYAARLRPGTIASLPDERRLTGTFCHAVLQAVFGGGGPLPTVAEAEARVGATFDERLPLDAATLAQPARMTKALDLRKRLLAATRTLVQTLAAGGYQVAGMELPLEGEVLGRKLTGAIDCLARTEAGDEAVIDLKYSGKHHREALEKGRALQLATYAQSRAALSRRGAPAVGYLVMHEAVLYTPEGSPVAGTGPAEVVPGPAIASVWERFAAALRGAEGWLRGGEPVPARPLQDPEARPEGLDIALEGPNKNGKAADEQYACRYCDYPALCGNQELA